MSDAPGLAQLQRWQRERLTFTYADLDQDPRFQPAAEFFFNDLYGVDHFTQTEQEARRAYSLLMKTLPHHLIDTLDMALELHELTAQLDLRLLGALREIQGREPSITKQNYAAAYRHCDNREERRHQIHLICQVGEDLDAVVHKPLVGVALRLARTPARLAGLGTLQDFLERGYHAFCHLDGAEDFLEAVYRRETRILERIFAGHPRPFARDTITA